MSCTGKKKSATRTASRSPASPIKSVSSGSASKGRGNKQTGRRRSRVTEDESSPGEDAGEEEEDEPSAKRYHMVLLAS